MRFKTLVLVAVGFVAAGAPRPAAAAELGINIEGVNDWGRSLMFADAMKHARPWGRVTNLNDPSVSVDADGWPTQDAGVIVITPVASAPSTPYVGGTYKLSFTGRAAVSPVGAPGVAVVNSVYDAATNTTTADVVASASATSLNLLFTNTASGVRNVRLMRPIAFDSAEAHSPSETFSRAFLQRLAPFKVIRFMDYVHTIGSPMVHWADRTLPTHATQARRVNGNGAWMGAAWEYAIQLCNDADKDMWLNVPDQATDDYVLQLATLVRDTLEPERKVYVEWSDEVWNWSYGYTETPRNLDAAVAEVTAGNSPLDYDGSTNQGYWAWRRMAKRMKEISDIFRAVFGEQAMMTRVRPVLAAQLANPSIFRQELTFIEQVYGPPRQYFYALGGAPYLGLRPPLNTRTDLTVEDIFGPQGLPVTRESLKISMEEQTHWARAFGLHSLAYESSAELDGTTSLDAKIAAARDPRMSQFLIDNLDNWYAYGGELALHYRMTGPYNQNGSAGLTENIYVSTFQTAAMDIVAASTPPALVVGAVAPATVIGGRFGVQSGWASKGDFFVSFTPGTWYSYLFQVEADGLYQVGASVSAMASGQLQAFVDGEELTTWTVPDTHGQATWQSLPEASVYLERGLHAIRLRSTAGSFNLNTVSLR
jgi:hypothetical protein